MRSIDWRKRTGEASMVALALGGFAVLMVAPVRADDAGCQSPKLDCQKVYQSAGERLAQALKEHSNACCAKHGKQDCVSCTAKSGVCDSSSKPGACDGKACPGGCDGRCGGACGTDGCGCGGGLLSCCLGDPIELFPADKCGNKFGGWVQFGYHSESNGLFNTHDSQLGLHQLWFYAEKVADGSGDAIDWGYRADFMYGLDAQNTQAFGNPPGSWDFGNPSWNHGSYGWALPQLYLEFAYRDLKVTLGHFYTLVGYETVTAPDNFFYSHAYTMNNSEPFTHTGVLVTYAPTDSLELYSGWTTGWDTAFDRFMGGSSFLGGGSWTVGDVLTATYITTFGDLGWRGEGYSHSIVLDFAVTEKLNYVFQSDVLTTNLGPNNHTVGVNQYLLYTINDCVRAGMRWEWWKPNGHSQNAVTVGLNIRPHANLVIRPEIRHDWNPSGIRFNGDGKSNFTTFGMDFIVTF